MRLVIALGGNALLRRAEPMTSQIQRANVRRAAQLLAPIVLSNQVVITHGNGPQIGLLALQQVSSTALDPLPLDVLGAQTEGMIGYLIEQELENALPGGPRVATLLTQVEVDPRDPAFLNPTKPVGPVYGKAEAERLAKLKAEQEAREAAARECARLETERLEGRAALENFVATYGADAEFKGIAGQISAFLKRPRNVKPCPSA